MKTALITGASSGIGKDMALYLNNLNYELILVGRNKEKLNELKKRCSNATVIICDLSSKEEVYKLYLKTKKLNIDLLINNAGFGLFGFFNETDLETELKMINVNIVATHILTKLFLKDFIKKDQGYILNVSSSAGFMPGPYLNTYYATKNYILKLTLALYEELKKQKSNVKVSVLCPGPVNTNFNNVAGGSFNVKGLSSEYVAKYALDQVFKNKLIIIPTFKMRMGIFLTRLIPIKLLLKITYIIQKNKFR
ncbi:MAG: SDR family oxidoreductase [Bacilli bacterium]|nr:SDR family oxidoreductase [Bacilli bacterium]MDD3895929.1 SDR family oxidoreductase [Bacilli bacterium]MDD4407956.1 SDR family oxidoreductase [Bacilli bacterium]